MKQKEIKTTVFEANDGKQFLTAKECEAYERHLRMIADIKYYVVWSDPDLTETGCFTTKTAVAVNKHRFISADAVVNAWAIEKFGYIGVGVQGYGIQRYFSVSEISKDNYFNPEYRNRVFLSTVDIEGFPAKTDVMSEWCKKYEHK